MRRPLQPAAHLIFGANGIAALTFCEVGIAPSAAAAPAAKKADLRPLRR
jgi:hypothetical protein